MLFEHHFKHSYHQDQSVNKLDQSQFRKSNKNNKNKTVVSCSFCGYTHKQIYHNYFQLTISLVVSAVRKGILKQFVKG